jgi:hypothetical protein
MGPNQTAALDSVLRALDGVGLSGGERMAVVGLVAGYVRGVAEQVADDAQARDARFWSAFAPLLDAHLDATRYPALTMLWRNENVEWVDQFEFGLGRVLDGIAALVESRRAAS